jgi:hypothetical protein
VFFNTLIPSDNPCGFGGSGWIMGVNQNDGKSLTDPLLDANGDGLIDITGDGVSGVAIIGLEVTGGIPGGGALISAGGGGPSTPPPSCLPGDPGYPNCTCDPMTDPSCATPPPCEPPKRPHVEVVLDSSGNPYNINMCLPEGARVGRYSWRELLFD